MIELNEEVVSVGNRKGVKTAITMENTELENMEEVGKGKTQDENDLEEVDTEDENVDRVEVDEEEEEGETEKEEGGVDEEVNGEDVYKEEEGEEEEKEDGVKLLQRVNELPIGFVAGANNGDVLAFMPSVDTNIDLDSDNLPWRDNEGKSDSGSESENSDEDLAPPGTEFTSVPSQMVDDAESGEETSSDEGNVKSSSSDVDQDDGELKEEDGSLKSDADSKLDREDGEIPSDGELVSSGDEVVTRQRLESGEYSGGATPPSENESKIRKRRRNVRGKGNQNMGTSGMPGRWPLQAPKTQKEAETVGVRWFKPKRICKYFQNKVCFSGRDCHFLHPGVNDEGFPMPHKPGYPDMRPPMAVPPGAPFPPPIGPMGEPIPFAPPPMETLPPPPQGFAPIPNLEFDNLPHVHNVTGAERDRPAAKSRSSEMTGSHGGQNDDRNESAWESGLRKAKEWMRHAQQRKEYMDFDDRKMDDSDDGGHRSRHCYDNDRHWESDRYEDDAEWSHHKAGSPYKPRAERWSGKSKHYWEHDPRGYDDDILKDGDAAAKGRSKLEKRRGPWDARAETGSVGKETPVETRPATEEWKDPWMRNGRSQKRSSRGSGSSGSSSGSSSHSGFSGSNSSKSSSKSGSESSDTGGRRPTVSSKDLAAALRQQANNIPSRPLAKTDLSAIKRDVDRGEDGAFPHPPTATNVQQKRGPADAAFRAHVAPMAPQYKQLSVPEAPVDATNHRCLSESSSGSSSRSSSSSSSGSSSRSSSGSSSSYAGSNHSNSERMSRSRSKSRNHSDALSGAKSQRGITGKRNMRGRLLLGTAPSEQEHVGRRTSGSYDSRHTEREQPRLKPLQREDNAPIKMTLNKAKPMPKQIAASILARYNDGRGGGAFDGRGRREFSGAYRRGDDMSQRKRPFSPQMQNSNSKIRRSDNYGHGGDYRDSRSGGYHDSRDRGSWDRSRRSQSRGSSRHGGSGNSQDKRGGHKRHELLDQLKAVEEAIARKRGK